ncbi:MAG: DeoR/GlpR transcriptional regulator [Verrucomicrobia bacterium]|nr:DeoR/GlpR transcriptional regulator [Verrucomicrobiota bacterium]
MTSEERQKRIEEHLQKVEFASLEELSALLGTSVSTIRRDVTTLESMEIVARTHGGARIANPKSDEYAFSTRDTHQLAEKEAIGRACADLISPNQTVILDAGTTCYHVARHLEAKRPQIFTNSLPVANLFSAANKLEVVVSGGVIYPRLGVLVGPLAVEAFTKVRADTAIMSCGGINAEGITNSHSLLIDIQRAMIHAARRVIFCVDSSKFGRQSISKLCDLDMIDVLITDAGAPADFLELLRRRNVEVIVASVPVVEVPPIMPVAAPVPPKKTTKKIGAAEKLTAPANVSPQKKIVARERAKAPVAPMPEEKIEAPAEPEDEEKPIHML